MFMRDIFFFNDTATTEIYTLSLHDALPILGFVTLGIFVLNLQGMNGAMMVMLAHGDRKSTTSELQSRQYLVCRLLLEKKNTILLANYSHHIPDVSMIEPKCRTGRCCTLFFF